MAMTIETIRHRVGAARPVAITIVAIGVGFALIFAWRLMRQPAVSTGASAPISAPLMTVSTENVPQSLEAVGTLEAVRQVTLAAEVPGRVVALSFDAGETVAAGRTLIQLYDAPERADLSAAQARVDFAKHEFDRSQALAPSGSEPVRIYQQRRAELAQARAATEQIEARIAQKAVRAPFAGVIGLRKVNLGQYVNAGDRLATITDLDLLYVNFTVPQQRLGELAVGARVTLVSDAVPGREFIARINAIEPQVGVDTRNVQAQAILDNRDHVLRPGLYGTVRLTLPALSNAITVPTTAIITSPSGDTVLVVRDDVAYSVSVITGARIGDRVVVARGLVAGDRVITAGQLRVQPGVRVAAAR